MIRSLFAIGVAGTFALGGVTVASQQTTRGPASPVIVFDTVKGTFEIETFESEAPKSVARIVELARKGFYRGLRFHYVQAAFVQVGDPASRDLSREAKWGLGGSGPGGIVRPIGVAEISKRKFERGIVGLGRRQDDPPERSDCQIFIIRTASPFLNGKYAAIGRVSKGMEVVAKIEMADVVKQVTVRIGQ